MWRNYGLIGQVGVRVDAQYGASTGIISENDGNQVADAGEYARYEISVRNTGTGRGSDVTDPFVKGLYYSMIILL